MMHSEIYFKAAKVMAMAWKWKMIRSAISASTFVVPELGARDSVIQA